MGTGAGNDLRSLLRTVRLGAATPWIIATAGRASNRYKREFERTVKPIIDATIVDLELRDRISASMLSYATKSAFVVAGYARMTGRPFAGDLAMLGLSFTRLYDDLLDVVGDEDLGWRVTELFESGRFTPGSDLERLLDRLYRELDRRLDRDRDDPYYAAVATVHDYQLRSLCQRDPRTPYSTLVEITHGKGGYGTLTVFALMRPALCPWERRLIMEIGEALQMLDDYVDIDEDRHNGVRTTATEGRLRLADVGSRLRAAQPRLSSYYGRRRAGWFLGVCYLTMWICFLVRRLGAGDPPSAAPYAVTAEAGDLAALRPDSCPEQAPTG